MQFSFCLILLSSIVVVEYSLAINDIEYIQCTSRCQPITVSFTDPLTFADCQEINETSNNYDTALVCGIEYTLDYTKEEININFHASNDTGSLEDQKPSSFIVQSMRLHLGKQQTGSNIITRKYGCNSENDCARKSYLNSIDNLINEGKTQIDKIISRLQNDSLITGPTSRRRCIDSTLPVEKPSVKCPIGICHFRLNEYQLDGQQKDVSQSCHQLVYPTLHSELEQHSPPSTQKDRLLLEYYCNKNVCNRNDIVHHIRDLIGEFTHGRSKVEDIVNEKTGNHSICQTISSTILVLFLVLFRLFI